MQNIELEHIKLVLKEQKDYLHQHFGIKEIGIFGSFAKGNYNEHSDVDIFIVMYPSTKDKLKKRLELKEYLETLLGRPVDVCQKNAVKPYLQDIVFKNAIYV